MLERTHSAVGSLWQSSWTASALPESQRFDAWASVLSDYFLPWSVTSRTRPHYAAAVRQYDLGGCKFIQCRSDPVSGVRRAGEIGRTSGDFFNVLYIVSGTEYLRFHDREVALSAGQCVLWDSRRRIEFALTAPLDKLTFMVPSSLVRALLPNAGDYVGVPLSSHQGIGALFAHHLQALGNTLGSMNSHDAAQMVNPTLDLLARALATVPGRKRPNMRESSRQRIRQYILMHLPDPLLSPVGIAADTHISVRYLHALFAEVDTTVSDWIRHLRLERCRDDLANAQLNHESITVIAYKWGFADTGSFSKAFRRTYGEAPRDYRRRMHAGR
jgi:AraC family transcriptional activator of tynA and feaB